MSAAKHSEVELKGCFRYTVMSRKESWEKVTNLWSTKTRKNPKESVNPLSNSFRFSGYDNTRAAFLHELYHYMGLLSTVANLQRNF